MSQKLLLHTCCAPCLSGCLHQLPADCTVVSYFFNPNITIPTEHAARLGELRRYAAIGGFDCIVEDSGKDRWQKAIHPLRDLGERSE
ncbi:MAG: epoxyqueuosine reductase QueH, partial [Spirochaetota bacterium]